MFTSAINTSITQTELDRVFYQSFGVDAGPGQASAATGDLFKVINTDHRNIIEEVYKGVGLYDSISEVQNVPLEAPRVTNKLTTEVVDFAKAIEISKNLFDDNMFNVWQRSVADMGRKARITMDDNAFKVFRNAFTTQLTADGVSAINAAHPLIGGGVESNLVTGALTEANLNSAFTRMRQMKDQAGVVLGDMPSILLVPTPLFKTAVEITQSALISGSAQNDVNIYRSAYGLTVYTSPYLDAVTGGSDTAWYILSPNHSVQRLVRQGIQTFLRDWGYSNNRTYLYQANFREEAFITDYAGLVGSTGL